MSPRAQASRGRTCIAPLGDVGDTLEGVRLCGRLAVTTRVAEGLECPLCAEHARELDEEPSDGGDDGND